MFTSMVAVIRKDLITVLRDPKEKGWHVTADNHS